MFLYCRDLISANAGIGSCGGGIFEARAGSEREAEAGDFVRSEVWSAGVKGPGSWPHQGGRARGDADRVAGTLRNDRQPDNTRAQYDRHNATWFLFKNRRSAFEVCVGNDFSCVNYTSTEDESSWRLGLGSHGGIARMVIHECLFT